MGCYPSRNALNKVNTSFEVYYGATTPRRSSSKRSYSSGFSSGSSTGVFSRCTTPSSKRSIASRSNTPTSTMSASSTSRKGSKQFNKIMSPLSKGLDQLSICDDFCDGQKIQSKVVELDKSFGYFSDSMISSPSKATLRYTRDLSGRCIEYSMVDEQLQNQSTTTSSMSANDLEMEMFMMTHTDGLMPKISSPKIQRRDVTYDLGDNELNPPTESYNKWCNYLQNTPAYLVHNITNIPEAVAGQFCPNDFPAYTNVDVMENAAKRYKVDTHSIMVTDGLTHTISTDL